MKERKSKRFRTADGKKNEKGAANDKEDSDYGEASNSSDSDESNNEKAQRKTPKRGQRRSTRKLNRKSLCELSDKEDDETVESSERNPSKRESGRRSAGTAKWRNNAADGDEVNGEKVQVKKDLRTSTKAVENENETEAEVDDGNENENNDEEHQANETEKPVKLSKKGSKRKTSLRTSEAKKLKGEDDSEKNGEPNVCPEETESSVRSKKGETKKSKGKGLEAKDEDEDEDEDDEGGSEEYEVEKLIDIYFKRNGKREFLVRWKGYSSKDDTWEPEKHLNCKELIDAFLEKCEKAKSFPIREMRRDRRKTDRYFINEGKGRKLSARLKHKPRKTYFDVE